MQYIIINISLLLMFLLSLSVIDLYIISFGLILAYLYKKKRLLLNIIILFLFYYIYLIWIILTYEVEMNFKMLIYLKFFLFLFIVISILNIKEILKKAIHNKIFLIFFILIFHSLFVSVGNKYFIPIINYLGNTYIPFIVLMFSFYYANFILQKKLKYLYNLLIIAIISLIILNIYYLILDFSFMHKLTIFMNNIKFFSRHGFHKYVELSLTNFGNIWFYRVPGINLDFVFTGYFWAYIAYFVYLIRKHIYIMFFSILFMILSVSKGALVLLFMFLLLDKVMKYKKFNFYLFIVGFLAITLIIISLITDTSGAVHATGLVMPFVSPINFEYFFGYHFNGGNMSSLHTMSDKLSTGAESFIGIIKYHLGLIGVIIVILIHYKIIKKYFFEYSRINRYITVTATASLVVSFLQENTFNLSYDIVRVIILFALISYANLKQGVLKNEIY